MTGANLRNPHCPQIILSALYCNSYQKIKIGIKIGIVDGISANANPDKKIWADIL